MKTIKELFEVYKPKSPDEQKFVDKHVTIKHKDRNGNDDDVFNATKIKPIKRKEERHGYDSGEDEKVYEDLEISDEELVFELDEEVEALEEGTVYYKHYTITSHPKVSGASEGGDIKHVFGHPKKMGNLDIEHDDTTDYGTTRRVTVKNSTTGETTHHHVYQSERSNSKGKPTLSIRTVGKAGAQQDKHANVIAHYLSGKTKLKEDTDLAFFDELLEMNLDEDTFTDASLAQLRVMKHKQKMKEIESSSKTHPLMKVRKLSDAKKKLAELEAARDKLVAAHEKAQAKKKVAEEVEELDELSFKKLVDYTAKSADSVSGAPVRKQDNRIKGQSLADKKIRKMDGYSSDAKVAATNEEVEELDELSKKTLGSYIDKSKKSEKDLIRKKMGTLTGNERADGYDSGDVAAARKDPARSKTLDDVERKMGNRKTGRKLASAKINGPRVPATESYQSEEVEQIDELSKAATGRYIKKASNDIANSMHIAGYTKNRDEHDRVIRRYEKRDKGISRAIKKLTKEDIINRAIEKYMPEDYVAPSLDEQFIAKIDHLAEGHAVTLLALFDSLNEENKKTMLETVDTQEGVNSLLDFAIKNRGE